MDYTPTTARSADAEVDDLHEDIMRFSLLERAGLTKQGEPTKETARHRQANDRGDAGKTGNCALHRALFGWTYVARDQTLNGGTGNAN